MIKIQLGVTDWLSDSSSIILTEKKKAYDKRNRLPSEICPFLPFPPYFPITLEESLSIKPVLQAVESRIKAEFLFHESLHSFSVTFF